MTTTPRSAYTAWRLRKLIGSPLPSAAEAEVALYTMTSPNATSASVTRTRNRCSKRPSAFIAAPVQVAERHPRELRSSRTGRSSRTPVRGGRRRPQMQPRQPRRRPTRDRPSARTARRRQRAPPLSEEPRRSEEHTSELQSQSNLVCRLLLEKKKKKID